MPTRAGPGHPPPTDLDDLAPPVAGPTRAALGWCDQWWDDERALPWAPLGHEAVSGPRQAHLIPQAGWYALGCLARDEGDDRDRARRAIDALCDLQYDEPDTDWHGTYPLMAETPHPPAGATMWDDYDPNWRQFLGLSWVLVLTRWRDRLPAATIDRLERAVRLGVAGEPPTRCPASYTNIALKRVAYESVAGGLLGEDAWVTRAEALAEQVAELHDRWGAFEEFGSPTYLGVDLYALAIARTLSPSAAIRSTCTRLETELWRTIATRYHPGLRNLVGPWTRTYGMDMNAYVAKLSLALRLVVGDDAPDAGMAPEVAHGHDLFAAAPTALVGTDAPRDAVAALGAVTAGPIEQRISSSRTTTAWMADGATAGAEAADHDLSWWEQYVAAVLHWRTPDGGIGWLTVRRPGPSTATAPPGELRVPIGAGADGPALVTVGGIDAPAVPSGGIWALPGIELAVSGQWTPAGPGSFSGTSFTTAAGEDLVLAVH